jgi:hypothetical protein
MRLTDEFEITRQLPVFVYRLYDASGLLLYVGISSDLADRFATHAGTKSWWPDVARRTAEGYSTRDEALAAEAVAIGAEAPLFNHQGIDMPHDYQRRPLPDPGSPRRRTSGLGPMQLDIMEALELAELAHAGDEWSIRELVCAVFGLEGLEETTHRQRYQVQRAVRGLKARNLVAAVLRDDPSRARVYKHTHRDGATSLRSMPVPALFVSLPPGAPLVTDAAVMARTPVLVA